MVVQANYFTLLFLGFTLWVSKYSEPVMATGLGAALGHYPELEAVAANRFREGGYGPTQEPTRYVTPSKDTENDCKDKLITGLKLGFYGYRWRRSIKTVCNRIDIGNWNGLTILARNPKYQLDITMKNNKISLNGQVVCNNIKKMNDNATYQKSSDGTYWYTNLKVGEPMTPAEMDEFEKEWAEYEEELENERQRKEEARKRQEEQRARERAILEKAEEQDREERKALTKLRKEELERQRREFEKERESLPKMIQDNRTIGGEPAE